MSEPVPDLINRTVASINAAKIACLRDQREGKSLTTDDFGRAFDETVADLGSWLVALADCAAIKEGETVNYWRVCVTPVAVTACPFELILYRNRRFSLTIGTETCTVSSITSVFFAVSSKRLSLVKS
jgi:hypothetical protein